MSRSNDEILLRNNDASKYDEWYLERGKYNVLIEDEAIINALNLNNKEIFLDIGCGTGRLTVNLASRVKKAYGIDISDKSIEIMNNKGINNLSGMVFDVTNDNFDSLGIKGIDKILSMQMIQHLEPKYFLPTLLKMKELLNKNGVLVCELYNYSGLNRKIEIVRSKGTIKKETTNGYFYEYRFTPKEMIELFKECGFKNIKCYGICNFHRKIVNVMGKLIIPLDKIIQKLAISKFLGYYFIIIGTK